MRYARTHKDYMLGRTTPVPAIKDAYAWRRDPTELDPSWDDPEWDEKQERGENSMSNGLRSDAAVAQPRRNGTPGPGKVDVTPLRDAFERGQRTAADIARHLDWYDRKGVADGRRVRRYLGLQPYSPGHGRPFQLRQNCSPATALKLARALGIDPHEIGL